MYRWRCPSATGAVGTPRRTSLLEGGTRPSAAAQAKPPPVAGRVVAVNEALGDNPGAVNEDPYDAGWLIRLRPDDPADLAGLLDAQAYRDQLS